MWQLRTPFDRYDQLLSAVTISRRTLTLTCTTILPIISQSKICIITVYQLKTSALNSPAIYLPFIPKGICQPPIFGTIADCFIHRSRRSPSWMIVTAAYRNWWCTVVLILSHHVIKTQSQARHDMYKTSNMIQSLLWKHKIKKYFSCALSLFLGNEHIFQCYSSLLL